LTICSSRVRSPDPPQMLDANVADSVSTVTERARKLRATYNIHAQSLRTRIEIRVNRIPLSLRKVKLGDLVQKYADQQQRTQKATAKGPPVPEKDINHGRPALRKPPVTYPGSPMRAAKRMRYVSLRPS